MAMPIITPVALSEEAATPCSATIDARFNCGGGGDGGGVEGRGCDGGGDGGSVGGGGEGSGGDDGGANGGIEGGSKGGARGAFEFEPTQPWKPHGGGGLYRCATHIGLNHGAHAGRS